MRRFAVAGTFGCGLLVWCLVVSPSAAFADSAADVARHIETIQELGAQGAGSAVRAARDALAKADSSALPSLLEAMGTASPVVANWLRSAYDDVLARELGRENPRLPIAYLKEFARDTRYGGRVRRLVADLLEEREPGFRAKFLSSRYEDDAFRKDAVAELLAAARRSQEGGDAERAREQFEAAFEKARDRGQWDEAATALEKLGVRVNLIDQMGYVVRWHLIGPFNAPETTGYAQTFPPESRIDLNASYAGQGGVEIGWKLYEEKNRFGQMNLLQAIASCSEAVGYAYAELDSPREQDAEIRCGADDNCKIWLNGTYVTGSEQWLNGIRSDRFRQRVRLKKGKNTLLAKICQGPRHKNPAVGNNWSFELRICDASGRGLKLRSLLPSPAADASREVENK